jgi:hypothetical protein
MLADTLSTPATVLAAATRARRNSGNQAFGGVAQLYVKRHVAAADTLQVAQGAWWTQTSCPCWGPPAPAGARTGHHRPAAHRRRRPRGLPGRRLEALSTSCSLGGPAKRNPFGIITGTSAGAINAAALASAADDFRVRAPPGDVLAGLSRPPGLPGRCDGRDAHGASWLRLMSLGWDWHAGASGRAHCWTTPSARPAQQGPVARLPGLVATRPAARSWP